MPDGESWKRMVLRSMPPPSWLSPDAPSGDIVLSTRVRYMRNLTGMRFVNRATDGELRRVMDLLLGAARDSNLELEALKALTNAERDYLVGCRLVSPDFEWTLPGRALLVDTGRSLSAMINEEDHLRLQALTAGLTIEAAEATANQCLEGFRQRISFAHSTRFGYLSASPTNLGQGRRLSVMFHLIGLAQGRRLPSVMRALSAKGIAVRGLFGESSRAIGAFAQVSVTNGSKEEFVGACDYIVQEEREARASIPFEVLEQKATQAKDFALSSRMVSLADALRVLAWVRWASLAGVSGFGSRMREVDSALTNLEIRGTLKEEFAARLRADDLRQVLEL